MHRKIFMFLFTVLIFSPLAAEKKEQPRLPENYKKWVEEEVVYIITSREKSVFLQLTTDRERDIFIEAFWKQRDPTPGTPRNEFREEHYRRFHYANEFFGRGTPRPGWKTDQGKIYIILGPPPNIEKYENVMGVHPTQIWFYLGDPKYGFPTAFHVIFFKKEGSGEYVLYLPFDHGPQGLIAEYMGDAKDIQDAYERLAKLEPNLARQSLTLIPGERILPGYVSMASTTLLNTVYSSPHKKVEDTYAEAILKYKDFVEVEYTANYIGNESEVKVIDDESGFHMVHYSIEPQKISVDYNGEMYGAIFEVNGRLSDAQGKTIYQFNKEFALKFDRDQLKDLESKSIALQGTFPAIPGRYRFDLLLKNVISKEFTSLEKNIVVAEAVSSPWMSPLVLSYDIRESRPSSEEFVPFKAGNLQILSRARKTFSQKETLFIFFQLAGLMPEIASRREVRYTFFRNGEEFSSRSKRLNDYGAGGNFIESQILKDFPPGYYKVRVSVLDEKGREVLFESGDFEITPVADLPRPLIVSKVMPASHTEEYFYILGIQSLNTGNIRDALAYLEKAYRKNPAQVKYALGYGQSLFVSEDYERVKEILRPFTPAEKENEQVLYFLGKASHLQGQFEEAISHYRNYLGHFGINLEILNLMGSCFYKMGRHQEALQAWEKSLEVNPGQEEIKKLVSSLKKK